jgi:hypothetical protein
VPEGIGAAGIVGFAFEVTPGTYVAPAKYIPINSESLTYGGEPQYRRPIRATADVVWAVPGNVQVGGDIQMDFLDDVAPYFMYIARTSIVKSGSNPNFIYTITPTAAAIPARTASITVVRNGIVFGYTGCIVSSFRYTINDGVLGLAVTILGREEATQSAPTPTWPTSTPYGAGQYVIEVPTGTTVTDSDQFEFSVEDNATPQFRLKNTGRGQAFNNYGERTTGLTIARDFLTKADYDAFKAVTSQSVTLTATKSANNNISMLIPAALKNSYEVGLSGQGDLLRANINYTGIQATPAAYQIVIKTQEDIT